MFYRTTIRFTMLYSLECLAVKETISSKGESSGDENVEMNE